MVQKSRAYGSLFMVYISPEIVHKINSLCSNTQRSSGIMSQLFPLAINTLS
jgi:hypothetical protein